MMFQTKMSLLGQQTAKYDTSAKTGTLLNWNWRLQTKLKILTKIAQFCMAKIETKTGTAFSLMFHQYLNIFKVQK
jgi:hypothetical protein